jgi:hypothetical protein
VIKSSHTFFPRSSFNGREQKSICQSVFSFFVAVDVPCAGADAVADGSSTAARATCGARRARRDDDDDDARGAMRDVSDDDGMTHEDILRVRSPGDLLATTFWQTRDDE